MVVAARGAAGRPGLARLLAQYEVRSIKVKIDGRSVQGYRREDFWDAWQREGASPGSETAEPAEPPEPCRSEALSKVPDGGAVPEPAGTRGGEVPEPGSAPEPETPPLTCGVPQVPEVLDFRTPEGAEHRERSDHEPDDEQALATLHSLLGATPVGGAA